MDKSNNKKINKKKDCCINSIKEIELFLRNLNKAIKSYKFIKYFK